MKIIQKLTNNKFSRDGNIPDIIVCHQTAGTNVNSALNWFLNPTSYVSANYVVDLNGDIYNCVPITKGAWANGNKIADSQKNETNHYLKSPNPIVRSRRINANKYSVSIEFVHKGEGNITEAQKSAGLELMKYIITEIKRIYKHDFVIDKTHIIGHNQISPVNKAGCAGRLFPFDFFVDELKEWKNPTKPVQPPAATTDLKVGDKVAYDGVVFVDSFGECTSCRGFRKGTGVIDRIIAARNAGYLVRNVGWFGKSSLKKQ